MKKWKGFMKKALSYMLIFSMCAPNLSPIVSYAAEYVENRPRYVNFDLPEALTLEDLKLPEGKGHGTTGTISPAEGSSAVPEVTVPTLPEGNGSTESPESGTEEENVPGAGESGTEESGTE